MSYDPADLVPAQLAAAGIEPSATEVAELINAAPGQRAELEALYAVTEARYEEPALVFSAVTPG